PAGAPRRGAGAPLRAGDLPLDQRCAARGAAGRPPRRARRGRHHLPEPAAALRVERPVGRAEGPRHQRPPHAHRVRGAGADAARRARCGLAALPAGAGNRGRPGLRALRRAHLGRVLLPLRPQPRAGGLDGRLHQPARAPRRAAGRQPGQRRPRRRRARRARGPAAPLVRRGRRARRALDHV
ncbi:MAG: hypothetical protein AVDCRST_MAG48-3761, partial [uncultured Friedmanniella sp.]